MRGESNPQNIVDFQAYRLKRQTMGDRRQGVQQSFQSEAPQMEDEEAELADRIQRIKASIDRIQSLMIELKASTDTPQKS